MIGKLIFKLEIHGENRWCMFPVTIARSANTLFETIAKMKTKIPEQVRDAMIHSLAESLAYTFYTGSRKDVIRL